MTQQEHNARVIGNKFFRAPINLDKQGDSPATGSSTSPLFKLKMGITEESPIFKSPLKNRSSGLALNDTHEKVKSIMDPGWHISARSGVSDKMYKKAKSKTVENHYKNKQV